MADRVTALPRLGDRGHIWPPKHIDRECDVSVRTAPLGDLGCDVVQQVADALIIHRRGEGDLGEIPPPNGKGVGPPTAGSGDPALVEQERLELGSDSATGAHPDASGQPADDGDPEDGGNQEAERSAK